MKKTKSIVLSIPKPCSENWDKMTSSEKGRYCSNCEKVITDLTQYTDKQLLDFISNGKGRICGKLNSTQINREIISYESGNSSFLQRLFVGTALATTLSACNESNSNQSTQLTEQYQAFGDNTNGEANAGEIKKDTLIKNKVPSHKEIKADTPPLVIVGDIVPRMPHFQDSNTVFTNPDTQPKYKDVYDYLSKKINYPKELVDKGIGGTVYVNFIVEKTGKISNVKILRGSHPMLDSEAVRVIRSMPKWSPGRQNGHPVRVQYMLPIHFTTADDRPTGNKKQ